MLIIPTLIFYGEFISALALFLYIELSSLIWRPLFEDLSLESQTGEAQQFYFKYILILLV